MGAFFARGAVMRPIPFLVEIRLEVGTLMLPDVDFQRLITNDDVDERKKILLSADRPVSLRGGLFYFLTELVRNPSKQRI